METGRVNSKSQTSVQFRVGSANGSESLKGLAWRRSKVAKGSRPDYRRAIRAAFWRAVVLL